MPDVTPSWEQIIRTFVEERLVDVRVALPCRVESYDRATQTANVKPQTMRVIPAAPGEEDIVEALPVIPNVKVAFLRGGGAFVSVPLRAGDFGHVVFSDFSLDVWRKRGEDTHPGDARPHAFGGAVFYPVSLFPDSQPLDDVHADNVVVGFDNGGQVHIKPNGQVHLGSENAADFVALAASVKAKLDAIIHALTIEATTFGDAGVAFKASMVTALGTLNTNVAASKTKAD